MTGYPQPPYWLRPILRLSWRNIEPLIFITMNYHISSREQEILSLIANEYGTREIAKELYISTQYRSNKSQKFIRKMDVKSVAGLVRRGFEMRFLQLGQAS